ncbi:hypothetical protein NXW88_22530 [Bacteroides cellulosilyticus]|nr:hypothetical protein NXW88_22530 [Bacteroides cellulosilyticus]
MEKLKKEVQNESNVKKTSHQVENQSTSSSRTVSKISIVDEDLLAERYYAGIKTHLCIGALRSFKLGYFKGQNINNISDLGMHLYKSGDAIKHEKGQDNLMEISSFMTELRKMWAVIQKEDTEHIDPYGYDVTINH